MYVLLFLSLHLSQCILIICTDTCLRPFESDMPNLGRRSRGATKGGQRGRKFLSPLLSCGLTSPALHLSPLSSGHVQYRGQLLTFELSESAHGRWRSLLLEEIRRPSLPSLPPPPPSAPSSLVVVVLCSCSPGLSCGVLVLVLSLSTWPSPNRPPRVVMSCQEKRKSQRGVDLDLGIMINTCINGRSKCTLPLYRLCKVLLIYCLL